MPHRSEDRQSIVAFLLAGALSACANIALRHVLSQWLTFELAVLLAYLAGMAIAFLAMRKFAFKPSALPLGAQLARFVAVNLWGLGQTLLLSSLLLRFVLPGVGIDWHAPLLAHGFALACQCVTSYFGHRYFTFRP